MNSRKKLGEASGYVRQNLFLVLFSASSVFGGLSSILAGFPTFSSSFVGISWVLGLIGFLFSIWRNYSSDFRVLWILFADLIILCMLIAVRSYNYIYPNSASLWAIIIIASVVTSYLIPSFNPPLAKFLRTELTSPTTPLGKKFFAGAIFLIPLGGAIGAFIGMASARQDNILLLAILGGNLLWVIAILLPFGTIYPMSPLEKRK